MTRIIDHLPPPLRAISGVLLGVGLGFTTLTLIRYLLPYHPPDGVDMNSPAAYGQWVSTLSTSAYLAFLGAFLFSAFIAGMVTGYFVLGTTYRILVLLSGFILLVITIGNFLAFKHPVWLTYAACTGFVAFAGLGGTFVRKIAPKP